LLPLRVQQHDVARRGPHQRTGPLGEQPEHVRPRRPGGHPARQLEHQRADAAVIEMMRTLDPEVDSLNPNLLFNMCGFEVRA
jgi:hypothetical protein